MRPLACSKAHVAVLLPLPSGSSPALGLAETSPQLVTPGLALTLGTLLMSLGRAASQPFPPCPVPPPSKLPAASCSQLCPSSPITPTPRAGAAVLRGSIAGLCSSSITATRGCFTPPLPQNWHAAVHCAHYRPLPSEHKVRSLLTGLPLEITPSPFISSHADPGEAGTKGAAPPGAAGPGCPTPCLLGAVAPSLPGLELGAQTLPSYQLPNKPWWL